MKIATTQWLGLKIERWRRYLTQWELSRLSNIPPYRISAYENGRVDLKADEIDRLRAALDQVPVERP